MAAFIILWFDSLSGISLDQPLVTSCGTGVTACVLALVRLSVSWSLEIYFPNGKWCFYNLFSHFRAFIASAKLMSRYMMDHGPNGAPIQTLQLQLLQLSHLSWPWKDSWLYFPCTLLRDPKPFGHRCKCWNRKSEMSHTHTGELWYHNFPCRGSFSWCNYNNEMPKKKNLLPSLVQHHLDGKFSVNCLLYCIYDYEHLNQFGTKFLL